MSGFQVIGCGLIIVIPVRVHEKKRGAKTGDFDGDLAPSLPVERAL